MLPWLAILADDPEVRCRVSHADACRRIYSVHARERRLTDEGLRAGLWIFVRVAP